MELWVGCSPAPSGCEYRDKHAAGFESVDIDPLAFTTSRKPGFLASAGLDVGRVAPLLTANLSARSFAPPNPRAAARRRPFLPCLRIRMQFPSTFYFSARATPPVSSLAEAILNQNGKPNFTAYSAGSFPPAALILSPSSNSSSAPSTSSLRSKAGTIRQARRAPDNFVFTVCDNAARGLSHLAGTAHHRSWGVRSCRRGRQPCANRARFLDVCRSGSPYPLVSFPTAFEP